MKPVFEEMLAYVPMDRILLKPIVNLPNIQQRYIFLPKSEGDVAALKMQLFDNFKTFYTFKWAYLTGLKNRIADWRRIFIN